jgi:hypothetical protein
VFLGVLGLHVAPVHDLSDIVMTVEK